MLRALLITLSITLSLAGAGTVKAADEKPAWPDSDKLANDMREAGDLIRQGLEKMLGSIDSTLRAMPRYELPTFDDEGNIIMRRKPPCAPADDQGGHTNRI
jgi:hypothetical protein